MAKKDLKELVKKPPTEVDPTNLMERIKEVQENLDSIENFQLPKIKMTALGMELIEGEKPLMELEGIVLHARRTNIYYAKPYNPGNVTPPDCFSLDGKNPDKSVKQPISQSCKRCPMAEFGTNAMKSGKACRNLKPFYMLLSDDAILPRQLTIPPTSLKAADRYLLDLTERGINYRKVKTKVTAFKEHPTDTYCKLKFQMGEKLSEQRLTEIEALRANLLPVMNAQVVEQAETETETETPKGEVNY